MAQLTGVLGEFEEIAGFAAAVKIAAVKGGSVAYIPQPRNLKPEHWLCAAIGMDDAVKIAKQFGGNEIEIPLGPFGGNRGRVWRIIRKPSKTVIPPPKPPIWRVLRYALSAATNLAKPPEIRKMTVKGICFK